MGARAEIGDSNWEAIAKLPAKKIMVASVVEVEVVRRAKFMMSSVMI